MIKQISSDSEKTNPSWVFYLIPQRFLQVEVNLRNIVFQQPVLPPQEIAGVSGSDAAQATATGWTGRRTLAQKPSDSVPHSTTWNFPTFRTHGSKKCFQRGFRRLCRHVKNFEVMSHPLFFEWSQKFKNIFSGFADLFESWGHGNSKLQTFFDIFPWTPLKFHMVHLKSEVPGKGDSFWKPSFSGSMLNFGGVFPKCS